jgi:hypothetical protein
MIYLLLQTAPPGTVSSTGSGSKDNKTMSTSKEKQACVGALACLKTVKGPSKPSTVQKAASNNLKRKVDELSLPGTAIAGSADAGPSLQVRVGEVC